MREEETMFRARKREYRSESMLFRGWKERVSEGRGYHDGMMRERMSDRES